LKAKGILMEKYRMTESQAHRFLQKSSMDRGLKLVDAAQMVMDNSLTIF
jgi:response regulator NasT